MHLLEKLLCEEERGRLTESSFTYSSVSKSLANISILTRNLKSFNDQKIKCEELYWGVRCRRSSRKCIQMLPGNLRALAPQPEVGSGRQKCQGHGHCGSSFSESLEQRHEQLLAKLTLQIACVEVQSAMYLPSTDSTEKLVLTKSRELKDVCKNVPCNTIHI